MIVLKTSRELSIMRKAGQISQKALRLAGEAVEPGYLPGSWIRSFASISRAWGHPQLPPLQRLPGQRLYLGKQCGHPRHTSKSILLKHGDIVSIDIGACYEGFHGDNAWTFPCGQISEEAGRFGSHREGPVFRH